MISFLAETKSLILFLKKHRRMKFRANRSAAAAAKLLQSCPTLCDPIDGSPTRLPRPWDSPGKNTGVGCHFLLQYMKVKSESEVAQSCPTPSDPMDCSPPGNMNQQIYMTVKFWAEVLVLWLSVCLLGLRSSLF